MTEKPNDSQEIGKLFIVATPIGNLEDITLRALRILKEVDVIACEDTRVTSKLLAHYSISKPLVSYHQHSKDNKTEALLEKMLSGANIALVTDAGTPGVSDPGNQLVEIAIKNQIQVVPIPGSSALATIVSVSGIDMQKFVFWGFPPHKKGRETFFKEVAAQKIPTVYYDSPHRVLKNLQLLQELCACHPAPDAGSSKSHKLENNLDSRLRGNDNAKKIIIGREMTKMFEEIVRGNLAEVLEYFSQNPTKVKGEFVVVVY